MFAIVLLNLPEVWILLGTMKRSLYCAFQHLVSVVPKLVASAKKALQRQTTLGDQELGNKVVLDSAFCCASKIFTCLSQDHSNPALGGAPAAADGAACLAFDSCTDRIHCGDCALAVTSLHADLSLRSKISNFELNLRNSLLLLLRWLKRLRSRRSTRS